MHRIYYFFLFSHAKDTSCSSGKCSSLAPDHGLGLLGVLSSLLGVLGLAVLGSRLLDGGLLSLLGSADGLLPLGLTDLEGDEVS